MTAHELDRQGLRYWATKGLGLTCIKRPSPVKRYSYSSKCKFFLPDREGAKVDCRNCRFSRVEKK